MRHEQANDEPPEKCERLHQLVRAQRGQLPAARAVQGRYAFLSAAQRTGRTRRLPIWPALAAACVLLAGTFGALRWSGRDRPDEVALTYVVEGGRMEPGGIIASSASGLSSLQFSDGTEVQLEAETKAIVEHVDRFGARVSLLDGSAQVAVVHVPGTHWLFDAGPFRVTVTGTAFSLRWAAQAEQLEVQMQRGSVGVSGPLSDTPIVLRAGQHLTIRARERETTIREFGVPPPVDEAPASASDAPEPEQPAPADYSGPNARRPAKKARAVATPAWSDWQTHVQKGRSAEVLREAERYGLDRCLMEASKDALSGLADAARYARRNQVARAAMLALRRRFPESDEAREASFLLGRLEESEQHLHEARSWYDAYLAGSDTQTYASEALGRTIIITAQLREAERARQLAAEYLVRFPRGTYAAYARGLSRRP